MKAKSGNSTTTKKYSCAARVLLRDICEIFTALKVTKMKSLRLLFHLCAMEDDTWRTYNHGKTIGPRLLAALLKEFGIQSRDIRFKAGVFKGYRAKWFEEALRLLDDEI